MLDTKGHKILAGYKHAAVKKYVSEKPFFFFNSDVNMYQMQNISTQWERIPLIFADRILIWISGATRACYVP